MGGSGYITTAIGGLVGLPGGAFSLYAIVRRTSDGAFTPVFSLETSAGSSRLSLWISNANTLQLTIASSDKDTGISASSSDSWMFIGVSKASGSSVPRGHKYVYSSNTWTHNDAAAATGGDSGDLTAGRVQIGRWQTAAERWPGDIALCGAVKRALTDGEFEQLPYTLLAHIGVVPDGLWLLDQDATGQNVIDVTGGGANQTALTGTAISTVSTPVFNYGAGATVGVGHAGGAQSAALGTTAETDTAVALARTKTRALGTTAETDTAVAFARRKTKTAGTATSTETAQPLGRRKTRTLGTATETDAALPVAASGAHLVGTALEADLALPLTRSKTKAPGTATSTEVALPLGRRKTRTLGVATELDTAVPLAGAPVRDLQLVVGPPELRWTAGQPAARWQAGPPHLKWNAGRPEV